MVTWSFLPFALNVILNLSLRRWETFMRMDNPLYLDLRTKNNLNPFNYCIFFQGELSVGTSVLYDYLHTEPKKLMLLGPFDNDLANTVAAYAGMPEFDILQVWNNFQFFLVVLCLSFNHIHSTYSEINPLERFVLLRLWLWLVNRIRALRNKTKSIRDLLPRLFPRLTRATCVCFEFLLVRCAVYET